VLESLLPIQARQSAFLMPTWGPSVDEQIAESTCDIDF
jgi:hypothetical protein